MFPQGPPFGAKPPETHFRVPLRSIFESLWEPSSLTYSLLVARVDEIVNFFEGRVSRTKKGQKFLVDGGRRKRSAAEAEPAEGGGGFASEL